MDRDTPRGSTTAMRRRPKGPPPASDRRFDPRRRTLIPATLDGHPVIVVDLSLGGLGAGAFEIMTDDRLPVGVGQTGRLTIPRDGRLAQTIDILVVRTCEEEGRFGARFVGLSEAQRRLIEQLVHRPAEVLRSP